MSRVVLATAPWYRLMNWHSDEMPLALCSLAGYLKARGHHVHVLNQDLVPGGIPGEFDQKRMFDTYPQYCRLMSDRNADIWRQAVDEIEKLNPEVLGMTVQVGSFGSTRMVAELFKERHPHVPVVVGGALASIDPQGVLKFDAFDYCIQGEGEEPFAELVETLASKTDPSNIANLALRAGPVVRVNKRRPYIEDLDALPFPDREALANLERYPSAGLGAIMTARGCPFRCTYCAASGVWGYGVRFRSPENVISEMRLMHERYRVRHFNFKDDTFTIRRDRIVELCELIRRELPGIDWSCKTRADCVDEKVVAHMAAAGCMHVEIGLESGCPEVLKLVRKGETVEQIRHGCKLFRRAGIPMLVNIIVGFPDESPDQMRQTLAVARSIKPGRILASLLSPYPGTEVHKQLVDAGQLDPVTAWETYFHASAASDRLKNDPDFADAVKEVFDSVEHYNSSRWRRLRSFGYLASRHPVAAFAHFRRYLRQGPHAEE